MRPTSIFKATLAPLALCMASPVAAQDAPDDSAAAMTDDLSEEEMQAFAELMGGMFTVEPLTAEQQARLPLAKKVTAEMMPVGFYEEIMADMMRNTLGPIMGLFSGPDFVVMRAVSLEGGIPELSEEQVAELAATFDPAYATRGEEMVAALTSGMSSFMGVMEEPMREGMARAYAARFTDAQLAEIDAFFQTPTGGLFARETMAIAADPQFMGSIMSAMPEMMAGMGDFDARMEAAMEAIPEARTYDQLPAADRARAAQLLGITEAELKTAMEAAAAEQAAMDEMDWDDEDWDESMEDAAEDAAEAMEAAE